jgi:hypothetical protein
VGDHRECRSLVTLAHRHDVHAAVERLAQRGPTGFDQPRFDLPVGGGSAVRLAEPMSRRRQRLQVPTQPIAIDAGGEALDQRTVARTERVEARLSEAPDQRCPSRQVQPSGPTTAE